MRLTSLHLILTYQCTFECDHCFVWGSPWQEGTMQLQGCTIHPLSGKNPGNDRLDLF